MGTATATDNEPVVTSVVTPPKPLEPKVNLPHAWAGRQVFYWRQVSQTTGEIAPLPAMLIEPTRGAEGWNLNFYRMNQMQGRTQVKFSDKPKAGCWTWPAGGAPKGAK